jgi:hypothetical protein
MISFQRVLKNPLPIWSTGFARFCVLEGYKNYISMHILTLGSLGFSLYQTTSLLEIMNMKGLMDIYPNSSTSFLVHQLVCLTIMPPFPSPIFAILPITAAFLFSIIFLFLKWLILTSLFFTFSTILPFF